MYGVHSRVILNDGLVGSWKDSILVYTAGYSPPPFLCGPIHRTHQDRRSAGLIQNGDSHNMKYEL